MLSDQVKDNQASEAVVVIGDRQMAQQFVKSAIKKHRQLGTPLSPAIAALLKKTTPQDSTADTLPNQ